MQTKRYFPKLICALAAVFICTNIHNVLHRGVMMQELMRNFSIGANGFGFIASLFFYGYAVMQIPAGLLLDRFGARRLLIIAVTVVQSVRQFLPIRILRLLQVAHALQLVSRRHLLSRVLYCSPHVG